MSRFSAIVPVRIHEHYGSISFVKKDKNGKLIIKVQITFIVYFFILSFLFQLNVGRLLTTSWRLLKIRLSLALTTYTNCKWCLYIFFIALICSVKRLATP